MRWNRVNQAAMEAIARRFGCSADAGDVLALIGSMGAGKTTFARAFAEGLGVLRPERVRSPTFNLCMIHEGPRPFVHIDLFRLGEPGDGGSDPTAAFEAIGLDDLMAKAADPSGTAAERAVVLVEWADLGPSRMRSESLAIHIDRASGEASTRDLEARAHGSRSEAWLERWRAGSR